jgi:hypothetical protein
MQHRPYPIDMDGLTTVTRGHHGEVRGGRGRKARPQHAGGLERLVGRARKDRVGRVADGRDHRAVGTDHRDRTVVPALDEARPHHLGDELAALVGVSHR